MLFDIYYISNQFRSIKISTPYLIIDYRFNNMHICEIDWEYQYSQDWVSMYKVAVSLLPECVLTCNLIFITSQFNSGPYKYLLHIFKLIIHVITCTFIKLIENINTHKIEFTGINWPNINFQRVYWRVIWYLWHLHSIQIHENIYSVSLNWLFMQ